MSVAWRRENARAYLAILFVASLLNPWKMRAGFRELAAGNPAPHIPTVRCPVLTEARLSAIELAAKMAAPRLSAAPSVSGDGQP